MTDRLASANPYRRDMLGSFLAHGLTREEAQGELLLQIVAGSDTTATAIRMTMLYSSKPFQSVGQKVLRCFTSKKVFLQPLSQEINLFFVI